MGSNHLKFKNRKKSDLSGSNGFTLVELLVTFALLAIFMTAVVACLPRITKIYMNLQSINHQKTICNTVSNQIRSEIQSALGVESASDPLGIKEGIGYITLIDDSGNPIELTTEGGISPGGSPIPAGDLTGETLEFIFKNGIIAQIDTKGYEGYTLRKHNLLMNYTGANAISSGAVITRFYDTTGDDNHKLSTIHYNKNDYHVSTEAGIIADGEDIQVAKAIEYPYGKGFYGGYDLKTIFTIKKDAFYAYGDGTDVSPSRTYVNYVNYTLQLYKNGQLKYSQDYVVNVQNAVPYLGTKVAVEPADPGAPAMKGTYVVPGSVQVVGADGQQHFIFHIEESRGESAADTWYITFPEDVSITGGNISPPHEGEYSMTPSGNKIIIKRNNAVSYKPEEEIVVNFWSNKTGQDLSVIEGSDHIESFSTPYASSTNCQIEYIRYVDNPYKGHDTVIEAKINGIQDDPVKVYMEFIFDKEVESFVQYNPTGLHIEKSGNKVMVYGSKLEKGQTFELVLPIDLVGGTGNDKPSTCIFGNETYEGDWYKK